MEVDDNRVALLLEPVDQKVGFVEWRPCRPQTDRAAQVDNGHPHVTGHNNGPVARVAAPIVGGTDDPLGFVQVLVGITMPEAVVAEGYRIGTEREYLFCGLGGDTCPPGRVFTVDNDEAGFEPFLQAGHSSRQAAPPWAAYHVADEQELHCGDPTGHP